MSYYILGISKTEYKKKINRQTAACTAVLAAAVFINLLLCLFRTDAVHTLFLVMNIGLDILTFSLIFFFASTQILPERKLYAVASREEKGTMVNGTIREVSEFTEMVYGLECFEVTVEENGMRKVFAAKEGMASFQLKGKVRLTVVDNIIVRAEVQQ